MSIRLFHTADLHLGAAPGSDALCAERRAEELWESFRSLIALVRKERPDFLLIAGDLFHRPPTYAELREADYQFSTIPETEVVLMAGNHDPLTDNSAYRTFQWHRNVTFFRSGTLTCRSFPERNVHIYGLSYTAQIVQNNLYESANKSNADGLHILMVHGGDATHSPFKPEALVNRGFDYIACGHIHKSALLVRGRAAYCGSPEPLDRTETGVHGFLDVSISEGRPAAIRLRPFAKREYKEILLQVEENEPSGSILQRLSGRIEQEGKENIYTIHLVGTNIALPHKDALEAVGWIEKIQMDHRHHYDFDQLLQTYQGTLIGEYIRSLKESDHPSAMRALEMGLDVFFGEGRE